MSRFKIFLVLVELVLEYQIKEDELSGAYGTRRRKQKCIQNLWLKTQKERAA
jgi:hypothetical protein